MSVYIVVLILLLINVILPKLTRLKVDSAYYFCFFMLTLLLCLRYGQGTDYFAYKYLYELSSGSLTWNDYLRYLLISHGQIGWQTIMFILNGLHISYEYFVIFLSLLEMLLLNVFINNFCFKNKSLALLLLYPTIYLTYLYSVSRQGLVICIFLGIMLDLLNNKKTLAYFLWCIICTSLHTSSIILFFLIFLLKIKFKNIYLGFCYVLMCICIVSISLTSNFIFSNVSAFLGASTYIETSDFYGMALLLRIIMMIVILILYFSEEKTQQLFLLNSFKIYLYGIIVYLMFFPVSLIASRLSIYFLSVDVILFVNLIPKSKKYGSIVFCILLIFTTSMTMKNINSYIIQGAYYDNVKLWNYPYVTLFDKNKIFKYRDVELLSVEN